MPRPAAAGLLPHAMDKSSTLAIRVEFGDCDPAGIVFYPNFFRWFDAGSRWFFTCCGLPPWRETETTHGIIGTPLIESSARFLKPASYGDVLDVETTIVEWNARTFVHRHVLSRQGAVLVEGREVRAFVVRDADRDGKLRAVPIPDAWRAACGAPPAAPVDAGGAKGG